MDQENAGGNQLVEVHPASQCWSGMFVCGVHRCLQLFLWCCVCSSYLQVLMLAAASRTKLHWRPTARHEAAVAVFHVLIPHQTLPRWYRMKKLARLLQPSYHGNCLPTDLRNHRCRLSFLLTIYCMTLALLVGDCRECCSFFCETKRSVMKYTLSETILVLPQFWFISSSILVS